jgi:quercetin dioxygenase-like cupin family protein
MAALLQGLPDDLCPCPHWGYVTAGRVTFTFRDHAEEFVAGDAFYVPPGHSPAAAANTSWVLISPADQVAPVTEAIQRNMALLQSA